MLGARNARRYLSLRRVWAAAGCLVMLPIVPAAGQVVQSTSILVDIPRVAALGISGDVSGLLDLAVDGKGESDYEFGCIESAVDAVTLSCTTNYAWDLSARLAGEWSCPGAYNKKESDLFIRISSQSGGTIQNGADTYLNLGAGDLVILNGTEGAAATAGIQHKILLDWELDVPGAYGITITYTLTDHVP